MSIGYRGVVEATTLLLMVAVMLAPSIVSASFGFEGCWQHFYANHTPSVPPTTAPHSAICRDGYYAICYDNPMKNPLWAAYLVGKENATNNRGGRNSWRMDPDLKAAGIPQATGSSDVWSMDWNRGHLAPSRIMSYSDESKYATYYYSNAAPQWWQFNQQPWESLEDKTFTWLLNSPNGTHLYVITGVSYTNRSNVVFNDTVAMPDYFFQVMCDTNAKESVGFVGRNVQDGDGMVPVYRSVREIELEYNSGFLDPLMDASCRTSTFNASHWGFGYANSTYRVPTTDGGSPTNTPSDSSSSTLRPSSTASIATPTLSLVASLVGTLLTTTVAATADSTSAPPSTPDQELTTATNPPPVTTLIGVQPTTAVATPTQADDTTTAPPSTTSMPQATNVTEQPEPSSTTNIVGEPPLDTPFTRHVHMTLAGDLWKDVVAQFDTNGTLHAAVVGAAAQDILSALARFHANSDGTLSWSAPTVSIVSLAAGSLKINASVSTAGMLISVADVEAACETSSGSDDTTTSTFPKVSAYYAGNGTLEEKMKTVSFVSVEETGVALSPLPPPPTSTPSPPTRTPPLPTTPPINELQPGDACGKGCFVMVGVIAAVVIVVTVSVVLTVTKKPTPASEEGRGSKHSKQQRASNSGAALQTTPAQHI